MLDPRTEHENNHIQNFDPFQTINNKNDVWRSCNFSARVRRTGENYQNFMNLNSGGVQLRPQNSEDESEIQSPPLWNSSPPRSPSNSSHNSNIYRSLSPTSRTQAIARGQKELMEMVKHIPESCYELSLKDLVEHPRILGSPKEESYLLEEKKYDDQVLNHQRVNKSIRRQESSSKKNGEKKTRVLRSASLENRPDLFLKMIFPVSFNSRRKKNLMANSLAKVSPSKPEGCEKTSKTVDKDWWKKRLSSSNSSSSDSGKTSTNNCGSTGSSGSSSSSRRSNSGRKKGGFLTSCFSCFYPTKSKSTE
ncbi:hypothetical protein ACH5RR_034162 [Cinchona calisaya]|uniref:Uncharacterized protein n=1 Tax=Cinchona calisaya TaxID=153742 RepID=A0ABD2YA32_9GENT